MKRKLVLRSANAADLDMLCALETRCFKSDRLSRRGFRRLISTRSAVIFVAESQGVIAGAIVGLFRRNSRIVRIYSVAVDRAFRGFGFGKALMERLLAEAGKMKCTCARLEVKSRNSSALHMYRRLGFKCIGKLPAYYADGAMGLRLECSIAPVAP